MIYDIIKYQYTYFSDINNPYSSIIYGPSSACKFKLCYNIIYFLLKQSFYFPDLENCQTKTPKQPTPPTCQVMQTRCLESQTCDGETTKALRCFVHFECSQGQDSQWAAFQPRFSTILRPVFRQEVESSELILFSHNNLIPIYSRFKYLKIIFRDTNLRVFTFSIKQIPGLKNFV